MSAITAGAKPASPEEALLAKDEGPTLYMSIPDIVREYEGAANPKKQIEILADENLCQPYEIARILKHAGASPTVRITQCESPEERKARFDKTHPNYVNPRVKKAQEEQAPVEEEEEPKEVAEEVEEEPEQVIEDIQVPTTYKAGTLANIFSQVDPDTDVDWHGNPIRNAVITVQFDVTGKQTKAHIALS